MVVNMKKKTEIILWLMQFIIVGILLLNRTLTVEHLAAIMTLAIVIFSGILVATKE
jgi:hypothetical protein